MEFMTSTCRKTTRNTACVIAALIAAAGTHAQCGPTEVYGGPLTASTDDLPLGAATGDLNNDGNIDVVSANFFGYSVSILYGNGDGTLQAAIDIDTYDPNELETIGALQVGIADFNGDGWNDIAIGLQSGDLGNPGIGILLNDGAGNFSGYPTRYAFSTQLRGLEIADMTGDGNLDIIYANRDDDTLNIVPGNGDGTFGAEFFIEFTGGPVGVAIADYDNDGILDVAAPMVFSNEILIAKGDGLGGLTELARFSADGPEGCSAADGTQGGSSSASESSAARSTEGHSSAASCRTPCATGRCTPRRNTAAPRHTTAGSVSRRACPTDSACRRSKGCRTSGRSSAFAERPANCTGCT